MATRGREGEDSSLPEVPDNDFQSDYLEPAPEATGTSRRSGVACRWKTSRFHDQECSRYFDCPSHLVERALSDNEQEEAGEQEPEEQEDVGSEDDEDRPDPGAVSPLSDDGEDGDSDQAAHSPSAAAPPAPILRGGSNVAGRQSEQPGSSAENPIILDRTPYMASRQLDSGQPQTEGGGRRVSNAGVSTPPVPGPTRRGSGLVPRMQATNGLVPVAASPTTLAPRPSPAVAQRSGTSEMVLPRWQPDSEVTYCPICRTQFSVFVRKHHCRKCGRVVCASCSPHRITIPHQYIVRPPGAPRMAPPLSPLDSPGWFPDFSGGERVRLCNPCVPDPNTAPPQSPGGQAGSQPNSALPPPPESNLFSNAWGFYFGGSQANDIQVRSRSVTMHPGVPTTMRAPLPALPPQNTQNRILSGTPPVYFRPTSTAQLPHPYSGIPARYRSMLDVGNRPGSTTLAGPSSSAATYRNLPPIPPPQPQIAEEDECPVCHRELPPRTLPNFESLREAHINTCITTHSAYSGGGSSAPAGTSSSRSVTDHGPLPPVPPRRTGMFPYAATEKDCVDSAECSICLEEFEVGVAMARLECLCRFHRRCIAAWWERHPGRCPMHQHDGFGY